MKKFLFTLALFSLLLSACKTSYFTEALTSSGSILYQELFTDPQSGWGKLNTEAGTANYVNKTYRITVIQPNVNLWTHPGLDFASVQVEVNALTASGPLENRMGVICRLVDDKNFYFFVISADGYYGIGKMKDGQTSILTSDGNMLPGSAILPGNTPNRVRGECVNNLLNLYINNHLTASAQDGDFTHGDVGIIAGTFSQPGAEIYFDNFFVFKP